MGWYRAAQRYIIGALMIVRGEKDLVGASCRPDMYGRRGNQRVIIIGVGMCIFREVMSNKHKTNLRDTWLVINPRIKQGISLLAVLQALDPILIPGLILGLITYLIPHPRVVSYIHVYRGGGRYIAAVYIRTMEVGKGHYGRKTNSFPSGSLLGRRVAHQVGGARHVSLSAH